MDRPFIGNQTAKGISRTVAHTGNQKMVLSQKSMTMPLNIEASVP